MMIFVRPLILRHFHDLPPDARELGLFEARSAMKPIAPSLCLAVAWQEIDLDFFQRAHDPHWRLHFVEGLDTAVEALRDKYAAISGELGVVRGLDVFGCRIVSCDQSAVASLEDVSAIPLHAHGPTIEFAHHVPKQGFIRPSPENPEASHLLAHAESERERVPSALKYVQVFEAGFGMRDEGKLIHKIVQYFSKTGLQVEKPEVRQWFNLRGEEAHAAKGRIRLDNQKGGGVSKPCWFALCSFASVG